MAQGRKMRLAAAALCCFWAAGCAWLWQPVPQQVAPEVVAPPGVDLTVKPVTPPAPLRETIPDAPSDQHVWIPGRWIWQDAYYIWSPGHWVIPPRPGAKWVPDKWSPGYTTPDVPAHWE